MSEGARLSQTPSAADFIAHARLMNGVCPTCRTIKAHDGTPRCDCAQRERKAQEVIRGRI